MTNEEYIEGLNNIINHLTLRIRSLNSRLDEARTFKGVGFTMKDPDYYYQD